jgi:plasmid stabilization system protein ParE
MKGRKEEFPHEGLAAYWSPLSCVRLRQICEYAARDKPDAAEKLATRIVALVEVLKDHPYIGRTESEPGVRELIVGGTYPIFSRVRGKRVTINTITIWHAAQLK